MHRRTSKSSIICPPADLADLHSRIKKAVKGMRVKCHPDKMKKPGMSDKELAEIDAKAAQVGQAADTLSDPNAVSVY